MLPSRKGARRSDYDEMTVCPGCENTIYAQDATKNGYCSTCAGSEPTTPAPVTRTRGTRKEIVDYDHTITVVELEEVRGSRKPTIGSTTAKRADMPIQERRIFEPYLQQEA